MTHVTHSAAIVGGGPAGLMAAQVLAGKGVAVTIFDAMPSLGRKFLMAGRGGLNLTHGEDFDAFVLRYGPATERIRPLLSAFPPEALRQWADDLGEQTFVGTSGRVFPRSFKASPLLRAWLRRLAALGVQTRLRHRFTGFAADSGLNFETPAGPVEFRADATILALGGASWPRLGSNGGWVEALEAGGMEVAPLRPANVGFEINWSRQIAEKFAGAPLKSVALSFGDASSRGEAMITAQGIEGGAVYALSGLLREEIATGGVAILNVDLRPDIAVDDLLKRLETSRGKQSMSTFLRKAAGLSPLAIALLREAGPLPSDAAGLAARIKAAPLRLVAPRPIARAISTAGGVRFESLDPTLMALKLPGVFVAGEMLDWEAPTGGYLLQACMSSGVVAARGALDWMASTARPTGAT